MRILKGTFAVLMGLALFYVQLFESRPAPCASAECLGFNIAWLAFFCLGLYALWRGGKMLLRRERPFDENRREQFSTAATSNSNAAFAHKTLDRGDSHAERPRDTVTNSSVLGSG